MEDSCQEWLFSDERKVNVFRRYQHSRGLVIVAVELLVVLFGCTDIAARPTGEETDWCCDLTAWELGRDVATGFLILISAGFMQSKSYKLN